MMWPDLPPGLATFIPRTRRVFPPLDANLPAGSRRCWNCRTLLRFDEPCEICRAPFKPLAVVPRPPEPQHGYTRFPVLPGLHARLAALRLSARAKLRSFAPSGGVDPRAVRMAGALIVALVATMIWTTRQVERNVPLGPLDTVSVAHAKKLELWPRPTAAVPRLVNLGALPVAIQESWIAPVGRRQYESLTSDRIRVHPTRRYRQYLRLVAADPTRIERVTQESGIARLPLDDLGDGLYAIDVRDAYPRPTHYRIEGAGITARIRVHQEPVRAGSEATGSRLEGSGARVARPPERGGGPRPSRADPPDSGLRTGACRRALPLSPPPCSDRLLERSGALTGLPRGRYPAAFRARCAGAPLSTTRTAPDEASVARALAALVPAGQPVVLAEPPRPALAEALAARGCQALVHPADPGPAAAALVDGTLARLEDPAPLLAALAGRLAPAGFVVVAHPNPAPAAARLAFLDGRPGAVPGGVTRFRADCTALLGGAGLAVVHEEIVEAPLPEAGGDALRGQLIERLRQDADARAATWLMVAHPVPWKGLEWLQERIDGSLRRAGAAEARARELAEDLDAVNEHVTRLLAGHEQMLACDAVQRKRLLELERELAQRDEKLIELQRLPEPPSWLRYRFRLSLVGRAYRRLRRAAAALME